MAEGDLRRGVRLGIDVGKARVGVAICDPAGMLATPSETIKVNRSSDGVDQLKDLVAHHSALEVIVGLPRHLSGTEGAASSHARHYAARLARAIDPVPVRLVDERLSTVSAHASLHSAGRKSKEHRQVVDQVAAAVILQHALDTERAGGGAPGELVRVGRGPVATKEDGARE